MLRGLCIKIRTMKTSCHSAFPSTELFKKDIEPHFATPNKQPVVPRKDGSFPNFHLLKQNHQGRLGLLETAHGPIQTPAFLFCATKGAVKGLTIGELQQTKTQILLGNTYHLMVHPGGSWVESMGGLHTMMGWKGPMFTDSGGYQIFSLGHGSVSAEIKGVRQNPQQKQLVKIREAGAIFRSYRDGSSIFLSPEISIQVQSQLGADLICVLDECTPFNVSKTYTQRSMELSHRWAQRSLKAFEKVAQPHQGLYGIVQGGVYSDLRKESADFINEQDFFGQAIGGSLGCTKNQMYDIVAETKSYLRADRPVHLLGIGGIQDIFHGVRCGIDTFDCVHPTRLGRHGGALVQRKYWANAQGVDAQRPREHINLMGSHFAMDLQPIDEDCPCSTCQTYSRAYLHYLLKAKELTALSALTIHNITFMNRLMEDIRQGILHEKLDEVEARWTPFSL
jgi:queuine tRNA-ribosyltransferase